MECGILMSIGVVSTLRSIKLELCISKCESTDTSMVDIDVMIKLSHAFQDTFSVEACCSTESILSILESRPPLPLLARLPL